MSIKEDETELTSMEDVCRSVLEFDDGFSPYRPHLKNNNKETLYMKWRKALMYQKLKNNDLILDVL